MFAGDGVRESETRSSRPAGTGGDAAGRILPARGASVQGVVTSRPEGVDIEDYKTRFVVVNLLELSQEQQRTVIQMQLQGNAFFDHLVVLHVS